MVFSNLFSPIEFKKIFAAQKAENERKAAEAAEAAKAVKAEEAANARDSNNSEAGTSVVASSTSPGAGTAATANTASTLDPYNFSVSSNLFYFEINSFSKNFLIQNGRATDVSKYDFKLNR